MSRPSYTLRQLANVLSLPWEGNGEQLLCGACPLESPRPDALTFCEKPSALRGMQPGQVGAVLASSSPGPGWNVLLTPEPRVAFAAALAQLYPPRLRPAGVHPLAVVHPSARVHPTASVGPFCLLGQDVEVEAGATLLAQVRVGDGARLGINCLLHPHVTLGPGVTLGAECVLEPHVSVGAGATLGRRVYAGSRVLLGAGCLVEEGCKMDNLVRVGDNARVGRNTLLISQSMVHDRARLGIYCLLAAQAVVDAGVELADKIQAGGRTWANADVRTPGVALAGEPAVDYALEMKSRAVRARLVRR